MKKNEITKAEKIKLCKENNDLMREQNNILKEKNGLFIILNDNVSNLTTAVKDTHKEFKELLKTACIRNIAYVTTADITSEI